MGKEKQMRRATLLLTAMALATLVVATAAGMAQGEEFCDDEIVGTAADNTLTGDRSGPCSDLIIGGGGDDIIRGLALPDGLYGDNTPRGVPGDDTLYGGGGRDNLVGNEGKDVMRGGAGNDRLRGAKDGSRDRLYCGPGNNDTAIFASGEDFVDRETCEDLRRL
jgi:Ca2+-binding RTX toxin-like protein